jgi:hypothetical protein
LAASSAKKVFTDHAEGAGYGWFVRNKAPRPSVGINGRAPGFSASLDRFLASDIVVAITSNLYSSLTQAMADDLGAIAHGEARRPLVPVHPLRLPAAVTARYVGRWQFGPDFSFNPNVTGEIAQIEGALALTLGSGGGTTHLIPVAENQFVDRLYGGTLRFVPDPSGNASELVWNFGRDYVAKRIRRP